MLFPMSIIPYLFFIPLTATILDDDIHYDIKWQPELTAVCWSTVEDIIDSSLLFA